MYPIFEQGSGNGIGHGLKTFFNRFDYICAEHIKAGKTKAFAFIFYDFTDRALKKILKDHGVFARLDRLSGIDLSIFYLHTGGEHAVKAFNTRFIAELGVEEQALPPCVVFFRVNDAKIEDVEVAQLDNADLIHGFNELYGVIEAYVSARPAAGAESKLLRWVKSSAKFVGLEVFRAALKHSLEYPF